MVIQSNGTWVVEEDECIYGEEGDMVDKKPFFGPVNNLTEV